MTKFKVVKYGCGTEEDMSPYPCSLCKIEFTQIYWYYIVEASGWFHDEKCAQTYILQHMGE